VPIRAKLHAESVLEALRLQYDYSFNRPESDRSQYPRCDSTVRLREAALPCESATPRCSSVGFQRIGGLVSQFFNVEALIVRRLDLQMFPTRRHYPDRTGHQLASPTTYFGAGRFSILELLL
jgi:hypothetical protein